MKSRLRFLSLDLTLEFLDLTSNKSGCLDDMQLAAFIEGESTSDIRNHVKICRSCRAKIEMIKEIKHLTIADCANLWIFKLAGAGIELIQKGRDFLLNKEVSPLDITRGGSLSGETKLVGDLVLLEHSFEDVRIAVKLLPIDESEVRLNINILKGTAAMGGVTVSLKNENDYIENQVTDRFRGRVFFDIGTGIYTITFELNDRDITLPLQVIY